jgi:hypothetical protein
LRSPVGMSSHDQDTGSNVRVPSMSIFDRCVIKARRPVTCQVGF